LLLMEYRQHGKLDYWRFYRRRFFRLVPALALFLLAYCVFAPFIWPDLTDIYSDALVSILYLADTALPSSTVRTLLHVVAVGGGAFLSDLAAAAGPAAAQGHARQVWAPLAALWLLSTLWRIFWVVQGQQFYEIFFRFDTRASGLLAGALLAALMMERPQWIEASAVVARLHHVVVLAVPLIMELEWDNRHAMVWGVTVVNAPPWSCCWPSKKPTRLVYEMLTAPMLIKLGPAVYGIYLWRARWCAICVPITSGP
jgi:peptidoglycan/LPS O-acetylase OafA/YrhL